MKIYLVQWGIVVVKNTILLYNVDFEWIINAIKNENYIISIWLFKNLPKMFLKNGVINKGGNAKSYVIYKDGGIKNKDDIKKMIKKLENVENIEIPEEKKQEILDKSETVIEQNKNIEESYNEYFDEELNDMFVNKLFNIVK